MGRSKKAATTASAGSYHVALAVTLPDGVSQRLLEGDLVLTDGASGLPVITVQPQSQTISAGDGATLQVDATSPTPGSFQWFENDAPLDGETDKELIALPVETSTYVCRVTNAAGTVSSDVATVTVEAAIAPPLIVTPPQNATITQGATATLTVVATGQPPLAYQWVKGATPIPGATQPTVEGAPTATATYFCRVSNAGGHVDSPPATVTVLPNVVPSPGLGLTYLRQIGLPSLNMGFAYGDVTGRIVDGKVRLLFTGDEVNVGSPIYEVEIRDNEPVATFVRSWDQPWQGKRGTWMQSSDMLASADALEAHGHRLGLTKWKIVAKFWRKLAKVTPTNTYVWVDFSTMSGIMVVSGGHYYHAEHGLLYYSYADTYNVAGRPDWHVLGVELHDDGTTQVFGPWRMTFTDRDGAVHLGPRSAMFLRPDPRTGLILGTNALGSGNIGYPWGPSVMGGAPWMTRATPSAADAPDIVLSENSLYHYYMGAEIDRLTGIASGPVRSFRRQVDPYVYEGFADAQANFVNPAAYNGVGSWTDNDSLGGFIPIDDRLYFFAGVAGSPIQDPTNCGASHIWYAHESNGFKCTHGCAAVPAGITGPVATARYPFACVYPFALLDQVKAQQKLDYEIEPTAAANLETEWGITTAPVDDVGHAKMIGAGFFNPATRKLYTIAHAADRGVVTWGLVNAYIHEWAVA